MNPMDVELHDSMEIEEEIRLETPLDQMNGWNIIHGNSGRSNCPFYIDDL